MKKFKCIEKGRKYICSSTEKHISFNIEFEQIEVILSSSVLLTRWLALFVQ